MRWCFLLALSLALPAHAYSGKELREDCLAAEAYLADNAGAPPESPRAARCIGYLEGFADGYAVSDHLAASVGIRLNAICLPPGPDLTRRLVRSLLAYLDRLPPNSESSTASLAAAALSRTFACSEALEPRK